ncbi:MAG: cytochrome c oxidase assembly protein [Acidimicrobiales bacterium]
MNGSPWAFHPHPVAWVVIVAAGTTWWWAVKRLGPRSGTAGPPATGGRIALFLTGLVALAAATTWPLADLSRHWLLLAHVTQNLILFLVAPPLLMLGLPPWLMEAATRPAPVDRALNGFSHPVISTLIFNVVVICCLLPPVVHAEDHFEVVYGALVLAMLGAGVIMWLPALRLLPGARHMSVGARVGYLFVQSILPNFPALILIFAGHVLYGDFVSAPRQVGLSPLLDQQLAGVAAKVFGITILWCTAGLILARAQSAEESGQDPDPLTWGDVERELQRLERRSGRHSAGSGG